MVTEYAESLCPSPQQSKAYKAGSADGQLQPELYSRSFNQ
jgi:hypothetical protein